MKKAVVLLSGGLDSATTLFIAREEGYECHCLVFDYNQRHRKEILEAQKIAKKTRCDYKIVKLSFPWRGSALLDKNADLPLVRNAGDMAGDIPSTYVPSRNTIFLSIAAGWAETLRADSIFIGANAVDFSGYPDCKPDYFELFNKLLLTGTKAGAENRPIQIKTPLIDKKKSEIIKIGTKLMVPYECTWSCYKGESLPCLKCDSCILRKKGFDEAGLKDPLMEIYYGRTKG